MTRKQEAIEIIGKALQSWYSEGHLDGAARNAECGPTYEIAKALYNRIAPLIRGELPIAEVRKKGEQAKSVGLRPDAQNERNRQVSRGIAKISRPREGDNILEQDNKEVCWRCRGSKKQYDDETGVDIDCIQCKGTGEQPKGTCQKCGGSGTIHGSEEIVNPTTVRRSFGLCPACNGTGSIIPEECQHKGNMGWMIAPNRTGPPNCFDCGEKVERRSGERREGKEKICDIPHRDGTPASVYEQVVHMGKLWDHARPNRRTKDRRKAG